MARVPALLGAPRHTADHAFPSHVAPQRRDTPVPCAQEKAYNDSLGRIFPGRGGMDTVLVNMIKDSERKIEDVREETHKLGGRSEERRDIKVHTEHRGVGKVPVLSTGPAPCSARTPCSARARPLIPSPTSPPRWHSPVAPSQDHIKRLERQIVVERQMRTHAEDRLQEVKTAFMNTRALTSSSSGFGV